VFRVSIHNRLPMFVRSTPEMDATVTSSAFNETSSDFALISSDNTIFYVPRAVLQLSSKVFETMFKAGTESAEDADPIRMQATGKELETVLKFAHPGHKNPIVNDATTLADLLRVAKQYEMEVVLDNLREWFVKPRYENGVSTEPIAIREPLTSFVVAASFEFENEVRFALREVVKSDLEKELDKARKYDIPLSLMHLLYKLRAARVVWHTGKVMELSEALITSRQSLNRRQVSASSFGFATSVGTVTESVDRDVAMINLPVGCLQWQYSAMKALEARPTFHTLKEAVSKEMNGDTGGGVFSGFEIRSTVLGLMEKWEAEAARLESEFPELDKNPLGNE
jgi:BTB/POZ domain